MLLRPLLIGCTAAFILGTALSVYIVRAEYDELLDLSLKAKAELLLPLVSAEFDLVAFEVSDHLDRVEPNAMASEEKASFWLVDSRNQVIVRSRNMPQGLDHQAGAAGMFLDTDTHRFFSTSQNDFGRRLIIAEPLLERNEVVRDSLVGVSLSMAFLVAIVFAVIRVSIRHLHRAVSQLSTMIAQKSATNLDPIDATASFQEMSPAVETINDLMARLGKAVEAERNFATNAAHELRTPLAVSLAQTQRLKAGLADSALLVKGTEVESGLRKLIHLVERLLQFSRAQSGLGTAEQASNANTVTALMFKEAAQRTDAGHRIVTHPPTGEFTSTIDPDALAIILSNLIDNAIKHSPADTPINLDARTTGQISISNDCSPLSAEEMDRIQQRFMRHSNSKDGFGVGLAIVKTLCEQSGCSMTAQSPCPGTERGMIVTLVLPSA